MKPRLILWRPTYKANGAPALRIGSALILAFPLAAGVLYPLTGWLLSPAVAALSMSGSTLIVVANALLLKRAKMSKAAAA